MDKRVAIVGAVMFTVIGDILLVKVRQPLYGISSLLAAVACLVYLLLQRRPVFQVTVIDVTKLYDIGWLASWGTAIALYVLRPESYERPLAFFIFIALACGFIVAKIVRCLLLDRDIAITLAQTIAVGLTLVWTVTLMYPSLVGLDPWTHRTIALEGINAGTWSMFPMWHRAWYGFIATIMESTGLTYRLATMVVPFVQVAGGVSLMYLIGRKVADERIGLLAALIMSISSWCVFFGYWTIPNGLGLTLVLLATYLIIKHSKDGGKWPVFVLLGALALLIFTHLLAAAWLLAILCIWATIVLLKRYRPPGHRVALPLIGVGVTAGALWGAGFLPFIRNLIFSYGLNPASTGSTLPPGVISPPAQATTFFVDTIAQPSWEFMFNSLGMILGFALAIAGCLWLLSRNYRNAPSLLVVASFSLFLVVGIIPSLLGTSVIEHRWWYAAQAFGAIPVAVAVIALHKVGKGAVATIAIVGLSFLMMIGLPCNMDNHTLSENQLARYALTQGELDAAKWALDRYSGNVSVDNYYTFANNLQTGQNRRLVGINTEILSSDYSDLKSDMVLIRDAIAYEPFAVGDGHVYKLLYDPNTALPEAGYKLVYSANGVNGYAKGETNTAIASITWVKGNPADRTVIR